MAAAILLLMPRLVAGGDVMIEVTGSQGSTFWDGVDKQGRPTGGHYETVDLRLVHAKGIYSTFTCRLEGKEKLSDWSGRGRLFKVSLDDAVIKKILLEPGCVISSTNLTRRDEIKQDQPNQAAQTTAPKVADSGR